MSRRSIIRAVDKTEYDERFCRNGGAYSYYTDYIFEGGIWWINRDSSCELTPETGWFPWTDSKGTVKKVIRNIVEQANECPEDYEIFVTKEVPPSVTLNEYAEEIELWKERKTRVEDVNS